MVSEASGPRGRERAARETRARQRFTGRIGHVMAASDPAWPERPTAPDGAPNIVFVLVDDVGFSDFGCYGGEIRTPNIDRLADDGLRFTNFHVNPMCSPTRASLLTGTNCHAAGIGHVAQDDVGFPGYAAELADDVATAAEVLRASGYATLMVGKWHVCRDGDVSAAGPNHSWPLQRGFDRFYGILDAFTNLHQPSMLTEDNHQVEVDRYPDGYYLTDDLTAKAVTMVKERKASNPRQPFFLYVAHPAAHAPLLAMPEDMARYRGAYDVGWDEIRGQRHARQLEMGVLPPGTPLPPRNSEVGDDVAAVGRAQRRRAHRVRPVHGGLRGDGRPHRPERRATARRAGGDGRVGQHDRRVHVRQRGQPRGRGDRHDELLSRTWHRSSAARPARSTSTSPASTTSVRRATMAHYPRGWAMASNTPFRLYKRNTHAGGHQVAVRVVGRGVGRRPARRRRRGDPAPVRTRGRRAADRARPGRPGAAHRAQRHRVAADGRHLARRRAGRRPTRRPARTEQYYELAGQPCPLPRTVRGRHQPPCPHARSPTRSGSSTTCSSDPVELDDLSADKPELVAELSQRFDQVARDNDVYPLDEGSGWRWVVRRPDEQVYAEPVTIWAGTPTLERWRSSRLMWQRSCAITIDVTIADGDRGVLVAHGDQGGGYVVYVDDGSLTFLYNDGHGTTTTIDGGPLAAGAHRIDVSLGAPGGRRWIVTMSVDGSPVGETVDVPMLFPMAPFQGIDVGIDRRSPVSWERYERDGPFPFTGALRSVRYEPGEPAPDSGDRFVDFLKELGSKYE